MSSPSAVPGDGSNNNGNNNGDNDKSTAAAVRQAELRYERACNVATKAQIALAKAHAANKDALAAKKDAYRNLNRLLLGNRRGGGGNGIELKDEDEDDDHQGDEDGGGELDEKKTSSRPPNKYRVGQVIRKEFKNGTFEGVIVRAPSPADGYDFYYVEYEDGDVEEFVESEIGQYIVLTASAAEAAAGEGVNDNNKRKAPPTTPKRSGSAAAAAAAITPSPPRRKKKKLSRRRVAATEGDDGVPDWFEEMRTFLLQVPHGRNNEPCSEKNTKTTMRVVRK